MITETPLETVVSKNDAAITEVTTTDAQDECSQRYVSDGQELETAFDLRPVFPSLPQAPADYSSDRDDFVGHWVCGKLPFEQAGRAFQAKYESCVKTHKSVVAEAVLQTFPLIEEPIELLELPPADSCERFVGSWSCLRLKAEPAGRAFFNRYEWVDPKRVCEKRDTLEVEDVTTLIETPSIEPIEIEAPLSSTTQQTVHDSIAETADSQLTEALQETIETDAAITSQRTISICQETSLTDEEMENMKISEAVTEFKTTSIASNESENEVAGHVRSFVETLQNVKEVAVAEATRALRYMLRQRSKEASQMQVQIDLLTYKYDALKKTHEEEIKAAQIIKTDLEGIVSKLNKDIVNLNVMVSTLQRERDSAKKALTKRENEVQGLNNRVQKLLRKNASFIELEQKAAKITDLEERIATLEVTIEQESAYNLRLQRTISKKALEIQKLRGW